MSRKMNLVSVPGSTMSSCNDRPSNISPTQHTQPIPNPDVGSGNPTGTTSKPVQSTKPVHRQMTRTLLMMPDDILTIVIAKMSYDDISQLRVVCHRFNRICQRLLNQGLQRLERYHGDCLKELKAQLPRRESERRQHPLARHCDILSAVETRLSLLAMTYSKYIDLKVCCFIPGKVIDEAMDVLRFVMQSKEAPRTHDLLQELRDISSMAMEHFDEKIAPRLKKKLGESNVNTIGAALKEFSSKVGASFAPATTSGQFGRMQQHQLKSATYSFGEVVKELRSLKASLADIRKVRFEQDRKIAHQQQQVLELTSKITSQNERISEQERKMALLEQHLRNAPGPSGEPFFFALDVGQEGANVTGSSVVKEEGSGSSGISGMAMEQGKEGKEQMSSQGSGHGEEEVTQSTSEEDLLAGTTDAPTTRGKGRKRRSLADAGDSLEDSVAAGTKRRRQKPN